MSINITGGSSIDLTANTIAALNGAEGENGTNPFATLSDVAGGGGGGSYLPLAGGTMTGSIVFGAAGQNIDVGSFDNGTGGSNGISLNCAVNYELNWQGGFLENRYSGTSYPIGLNSNLIFGTIGSGTYTEISSNGSVWVTGDYSAYGEYTKQRFYIGTSGTTNPVWIDASLNAGSGLNPSIQILADIAPFGSPMKIDGFGLTFPDGSTQVTATVGTGDQTLATTDDVQFKNLSLIDGSYKLIADVTGNKLSWFYDTNELAKFDVGGITFGSGTGSLTQYLYSGITFPDGSTQTTSASNITSLGSLTLTDLSTNLTLSGSIQFADFTTQSSAPVASTGTVINNIAGDIASADYPDEVTINIGGVVYAMPARVVP